MGIVVVAVLLLISLCSCGHYASPDQIFSDFTEKYALPTGKVYRTSAGEADETYLSHEQFRVVYARPDGSDDWEDIESCVLWQGTSLHYVYEMGVFLCKDGDAAESVVLMCQNRLKLILSMRSYADTTAGDTAVIRVSGRMVVMMVLPDNALAKKCLDRVL